MNTRYTLRAIALAGVSLLPLAAFAAEDASDKPQYNNEVSVGGRWQSENNPFFGRYNGFGDSGFGLLGGFAVRSRDAWDSKGTQYLEATGKNIDFTDNRNAPESSVAVKFGQQGWWGANVAYDAITYTGNTIYTPYTASGSLVPGLLPYGGASLTAPGSVFTTTYGNRPTSLIALLAKTPTDTRRDIVSGGANYRMGDWLYTINLRHEHKDGTMEQTVDGSYTGIGFAQPIDYDTDRYTVSAAYSTRQLQAQLNYSYSRFTDNNTAFNATYFTSPTATSNALYQAAAAYSLPPSNDAHYVTGALGYNLLPGTRFTGNFRYGVELQNDNMEPTTYSTAAQFASLTGGGGYSLLSSNPSSLQGKAQVYGATAQISSNPLNNLDLTANYRLDGRDASTPVYTVAGFHGTDGAISANASSSFPQSWLKQNAAVEAGYRLLPSSNTKVTVGYAYDNVDRSIAQVGHSNSSTLSAKISSSPLMDLSGSAAYEHGNRSAVTNCNLPWQYLANSGATACEQSIAFYQAPMTTDAAKFRANYTPNEALSVGLFGKFAQDHYHYPGFNPANATGYTGTSMDRNISAGPDVAYRLSKDISLHAFYTFERIFFANNGNGAGPASVPPGTDRFTAATTDDVHTVGLSGDWKITDRLKLGASYNFYYGDVSYYMYNGVVVPGTPTVSYANVAALPNVNSSMHSLKLNGQYALTPTMTLWGGYSYDVFKDNDWAYNTWAPVTPTSATGGATLSTGVPNPSYHVNAVYTGVTVKF